MPSLHKIGKTEIDYEVLEKLLHFPKDHKIVRAYIKEMFHPPKLVIMIEGPTMPFEIPLGAMIPDVKIELKDGEDAKFT